MHQSVLLRHYDMCIVSYSKNIYLQQNMDACNPKRNATKHYQHKTQQKYIAINFRSHI